MLNLTMAETLFYGTIKLTAYNSGAVVSTGTGFFMALDDRDETVFPVIVTNKHVISGADLIIATCHLADNDRPSGKFVTCSIKITPGSYIQHPDPNIDLCALPIGDIINQAEIAKTPIFFKMAKFDIIPTAEEWQNFDALEEVTMIGCPNGISDEVNNLPVARRGITASPLSRLYNGKSEFLVDMACFPGSSGSPIFIYDRNGFLDRKTNIYMMGKQRIFLVGILYAGPQIANSGHVILAQPPTVRVAAMMHLGNAIRSSELRALDAEATKLFPNLSPPQTNVGPVVQ